MWSTILVPTDFSAASDAALALAARLAREQSARVEILHVVELGGGLHRDTRLHPDDTGAVTVEELVRQRTVPRLEEQALRAGLEAVPHRYDITFGASAEAIVQHATSCGADLIVMATHGRRGLERFIIGSCAEAVLRRASVPVLALRVPSEPLKLTPEEQALADESTG